MKDVVVSQPGFSFWFQSFLLLGVFVVGLGSLAEWIPGEMPYGKLGAIGMVLIGGFALGGTIAGWQRFSATPNGLVRERVGKRDVVPWSELGGPEVRELEADLSHHSAYEFMAHDAEPGMHVTTYRDRQGRVVCSLGPRFANRSAFVAAVRRYVRETRRAG